VVTTHRDGQLADGDLHRDAPEAGVALLVGAVGDRRAAELDDEVGPLRHGADRFDEQDVAGVIDGQLRLANRGVLST
jgi:hypothetical protein